jgi:hypothetical protein
MREKLLVPYSFMVMNFAAVAALVYYASGRRDVWVDRRDRVGSMAGGGVSILARGRR